MQRNYNLASGENAFTSSEISDRPFSKEATLFKVMTRFNYEKGDPVGVNGMKYVKEAPALVCKDGSIKRKATFKCPCCGKQFIALIDNVRSGKTKSCRCSHIKHGLCFKFGYSTWNNIKQRTMVSTANNYKNYGGRGITMHEPWIHDFKAFYDYVSSLPYFGEKGRTLDRKNNYGNYEPGNLRWATSHTQNANMRMRSVNKSGYIGVAYVMAKRMYRSAITIHNKTIHLGYYKNSLNAAVRRDNYIKKHNLTEYTLNFK